MPAQYNVYILEIETLPDHLALGRAEIRQNWNLKTIFNGSSQLCSGIDTIYTFEDI